MTGWEYHGIDSFFDFAAIAAAGNTTRVLAGLTYDAGGARNTSRWLASWRKRLAFLAARVRPAAAIGVGLSSDSWYTPCDRWLRARVAAAAAAGAGEIHVWVDEVPAAWVPELARFLQGNASTTAAGATASAVRATPAWARPWHRRRRRRTAGDSCPTCAEALCQPDCAHDPHKGSEACNASAPVMSCSGCAAPSSTVGFGGTCVCTCSSPADFLFVLAPILGGISLVLCLCFARTYRRDEFMSVGESRRRRSGYTAASVTDDGDL